jgi:predicted dehydrogenase
MTEIRWGILGTGTIAYEFAYGLSFIPEARLLAIASRSSKKAETFANAYRIPKIYDSYEALVQDNEVDIVYIATPHFRHKQDCLLCLNSGKAVLCEKPLAMNANEAREIADVARSQGIFCMEAMWMRFMPLIQEVQSLIQNGKIGEVLMFSADFGYPTEFDPENRFFNLKLGGGSLLDRGCYPISLAFQLMGAPSSVKGQASLGSTGVDEQSAIVMSYQSGGLAQISTTLRTYASNVATITGTKGKITIHPPFCRPDRISITPFSETPVVVSSSPMSSSSKLKRQIKSAFKEFPLVRRVLESARDKTVSISKSVRGNGLNYEALEVIRCLKQNWIESPLMPLRESIMILEVMDELRSSWGVRYPQDDV